MKKRNFHFWIFLISCSGLLMLSTVWLIYNSLFSSKSPEYLYVIHSSKDSDKKLYRFERGIEEPVALSLEGVQGELWDFCALKGKLYLLYRQDSAWYMEECDADGTFLRVITESGQLRESDNALKTLWTDGSRIYLVRSSKENTETQEEWIESFLRTEDGCIYDAPREYLCLNERTGIFEETSLSTTFSRNTLYPKGIGQERGFSYASSFLWDGKQEKTVGLAFYSYDQKEKQGSVLPVDEALLEEYGYPDRKVYYHSGYQDGTTLYVNFLNSVEELELFAVTVKEGKINDCQLIEEGKDCEVRWAGAGHLLLIGNEGCYEYEKGKGLIPLEFTHWRSVHASYGTLYSSENGYAIVSYERENETGEMVPLSEGEALCFLRWYGEETAREYWFREK